MNFVKSKHIFIFFLRVNLATVLLEIFLHIPAHSLKSPAHYFNQRLLNFSKYFASDADYIFIVRSVYEQHYLRPPTNVTVHKVKPGTYTAGLDKNDFKVTN